MEEVISITFGEGMLSSSQASVWQVEVSGWAPLHDALFSPALSSARVRGSSYNLCPIYVQWGCYDGSEASKMVPSINSYR